MCLKSLGEKDEVTILSPFKKSRNISSPTFFSYMFPSFAYSQIILSTVWRRALTVVINTFKLPRSARIPSMLFLVTGPLIHYILSPGVSMKLQGHRWTVWIIRKLFPIFSWNLPPYNPAHWVWSSLLELQKNESTLSTSHPFKCLQAAATSVQSHLIWHQLVRHVSCPVAKGG